MAGYMTTGLVFHLFFEQLGKMFLKIKSGIPPYDLLNRPGIDFIFPKTGDINARTKMQKCQLRFAFMRDAD